VLANRATPALFQRQRSIWSWFVYHILFPLVPFSLEFCIRLTVNKFRPDWRILSSATLAMSTGLILFFVRECVEHLRSRMASRDAKRARCTELIIFAIFFFALFAIITAFSAFGTAEAQDLEHHFDFLVLVAFPLAIIYLLRVRSEFGLGITS
jgi:hypothetical protein